jgi:hypothetical protein
MKSVLPLAFAVCLVASALPVSAREDTTLSGPLARTLARQAPQRDVCITIDEARDTFSPQDRAAALLLVVRQFELAGVRVVPGDCSTPYTVSHVRLGNVITVTLSGSHEYRDGTALGLDDLPALYSATSEPFTSSRAAPQGVMMTAYHYTPSLSISVGLGWQRDRRAHR